MSPAVTKAVLFACILGLVSGSPSHISEKNKPKGVVEPDNCGGNGVVLEARVSGCEGLPCDVAPGTSLIFETDFIPTMTTVQARLKMSARVAGSVIPINDIEIGDLSPGVAYTATQLAVAASNFAGQTVEFQKEIFDPIIGLNVLCLNIPMQILDNEAQ